MPALPTRAQRASRRPHSAARAAAPVAPRTGRPAGVPLPHLQVDDEAEQQRVLQGPRAVVEQRLDLHAGADSAAPVNGTSACSAESVRRPARVMTISAAAHTARLGRKAGQAPWSLPPPRSCCARTRRTQWSNRRRRRGGPTPPRSCRGPPAQQRRRREAFETRRQAARRAGGVSG